MTRAPIRRDGLVIPPERPEQGVERGDPHITEEHLAEAQNDATLLAIKAQEEAGLEGRVGYHRDQGGGHAFHAAVDFAVVAQMGLTLTLRTEVGVAPGDLHLLAGL